MRRSVLLLLIGFFAAVTLTASASAAPPLADPNPDFAKYLQGLQSRQKQTAQAPSLIAPQTGLVPSPVNYAYLSGARISFTTTAMPGAFDLREQGKLTPVRDQGPWGVCWTFASCGSLESFLLPAEVHDFSEEHMALRHGFDGGLNAGGNRDMASAYLARWSGPVAEADDAYGDGVSPDGLNTAKHVQDILYLPPRQHAADNDLIKWALQSHGALYTTISWTPLSYSETHAAYYYGGSEAANHAVLIVGWDDAYSRTNFSAEPPGDGAFIVRNSWGASWGDGGYCYVSYHDTIIATELAAFAAEPADNYTGIYQHDELGATAYAGWPWMANRFVAAGPHESLTAVAFYAPVPDTAYEIYVGGTLADRQLACSGTIAIPGYRTVKLPEAKALREGEAFHVIVKLAAPSTQYVTAIEYPWSHYSSAATAQANESFASPDGSTWTDMGASGSPYRSNVCLKAFTTTSGESTATLPKWQVSLKASPTLVNVNQSITYSGTVKTTSGKAGLGTVTLQKRPAAGGSWTAWKTATLGSNGSYSLSVKMTSAQVSQVRARKSANAANATGFSASRKITVRALPKWQVSLNRSPSQVNVNQKIVYSGTVKTASGKPGSGTVTLQKRPASGGAWKNWQTVTLRTDGSYRLAKKMTLAQVSQVRARKAATSANQTGFSASRKVTVVSN
jgi:C1A family cysteine protease